MYKDFKQSDSLDTGFAAGSSLLWMFSGIVLGLLVGLGMYFFSNDRLPSVSMIDTLEDKIQKIQTNPKSSQFNTINKTTNEQKVGRASKIANGADEERKNKFSYYAVLPNLNVPVGETQPIKTGSSAEDMFIDDSVTESATSQEVVVVEEAVLKEKAQDVSIGDYMLQVASFRKESMADKTRGRLSNKGVDAYVQKKKIKGRYWYRVVAGPVDQSSVRTWKSTAEKLGHKPLVFTVR